MGTVQASADLVYVMSLPIDAGWENARNWSTTLEANRRYMLQPVQSNLSKYQPSTSYRRCSSTGVEVNRLR
jgi:hypothetical protein